MTAPDANAQPRFCSTCGFALPGAVPRCPQCGREAPTGRPGGMGPAAVVAIVAGVVVGGVCVVGILAAIAIPNFIKYQLRAKASEVTLNLELLVRAEQAARERTGSYLALPRMPAGAPGAQQAPLSPEEHQRALELDWITPASLHGRYAVAVSEDGGAAAICGESDVDGDGVLAVRVAFLPDAAGRAPAAPCTEPIEYAGQPAGTIEQVSGDNVF